MKFLDKTGNFFVSADDVVLLSQELDSVKSLLR
jgi:hypothetical protein